MGYTLIFLAIKTTHLECVYKCTGQDEHAKHTYMHLLFFETPHFRVICNQPPPVIEKSTAETYLRRREYWVGGGGQQNPEGWTALNLHHVH